MGCSTSQHLNTVKNDTSAQEHALWGSKLEAAESAKGWNECVKNPGHNTFIPARDFRIDCLPVEWQNEDFVELIKVWSDLTVRLRVGTCCGGQRVGTGFVRYVHRTTGPCPCIICNGQPVRRQRSWTFTICTAKHVIDNDLDLKMTSVDFFHDYEDSRRDGNMKTLPGGNLVHIRADRDWCKFNCVCHECELAAKMVCQVERRDKLAERLREWVLSLRPYPHIIVSHPHGRPKHVTVGEEIDVEWNSGITSYSTDTCPGTSGALGLGFGGGWGYGAHHCLAGDREGFNKGYHSLW